MKAHGGNYYLMESGARLGGVSETQVEHLAKTAKHGVNEILIETNFGGLEIYQQVLKAYLRQVGAGVGWNPSAQTNKETADHRHHGPDHADPPLCCGSPGD